MKHSPPQSSSHDVIQSSISPEQLREQNEQEGKDLFRELVTDNLELKLKDPLYSQVVLLLIKSDKKLYLQIRKQTAEWLCIDESQLYETAGEWLRILPLLAILGPHRIASLLEEEFRSPYSPKPGTALYKVKATGEPAVLKSVRDKEVQIVGGLRTNMVGKYVKGRFTQWPSQERIPSPQDPITPSFVKHAQSPSSPKQLTDAIEELKKLLDNKRWKELDTNQQHKVCDFVAQNRSVNGFVDAAANMCRDNDMSLDDAAQFVFRGLETPDEEPFYGLHANDPLDKRNIANHVKDGGKLGNLTCYLSMTESPTVAVTYALHICQGKYHRRVVKVDLRKCVGTVFYLASYDKCDTHNVKAIITRRAALAAEEVVLHGWVPPEAIVEVFELDPDEEHVRTIAQVKNKDNINSPSKWIAAYDACEIDDQYFDVLLRATSIGSAYQSPVHDWSFYEASQLLRLLLQKLKEALNYKLPFLSQDKHSAVPQLALNVLRLTSQEPPLDETERQELHASLSSLRQDLQADTD